MQNNDTGVNMENKIHIQALNTIDPDWVDESLTLQEMIEYYLTFQCKDFAHYCDDEVLDIIKNILYDNQDDKIGRIKDIYDFKISELAKQVATQHEHKCMSNQSQWIYDEAMKHFI
jgi:hypothetical protein